MSERSEALRLAGELDAELARTVAVDMLHHNAAAELRRLHAENEAQASRIEADEALLRRAFEALEAVTLHFTSSPSTVADSNARFAAHKAMHALRARLEAQR